MKRNIKKAYAKINLHLDVASRYPDGFHEVHTVMQSLSLCDDVEILLDDSLCGISVACDGDGIPSDENNIAWRAARLYLDRVGMSDAGVKISIRKRIPVCSGMGGGSADAAAVLLGLNEIFDEKIDMGNLLSLGAEIGADVPFCMTGGTAYADGKGDVLHEFPSMPECHILISRGGEGVSTPWAYRELDRIYDDFTGGYLPLGVEKIKSAIESQSIENIGKCLYNVFEKAILPSRPIAAGIRKEMLDNGALGALMSGSGTAIFGLFDNEQKAKALEEKLRTQGYFSCVTKPREKFASKFIF